MEETIITILAESRTIAIVIGGLSAGVINTLGERRNEKAQKIGKLFSPLIWIFLALVIYYGPPEMILSYFVCTVISGAFIPFMYQCMQDLVLYHHLLATHSSQLKNIVSPPVYCWRTESLVIDGAKLTLRLPAENGPRKNSLFSYLIQNSTSTNKNLNRKTQNHPLARDVVKQTWQYTGEKNLCVGKITMQASVVEMGNKVSLFQADVFAHAVNYYRFAFFQNSDEYDELNIQAPTNIALAGQAGLCYRVDDLRRDEIFWVYHFTLTPHLMLVIQFTFDNSQEIENKEVQVKVRTMMESLKALILQNITISPSENTGSGEQFNKTVLTANPFTKPSVEKSFELSLIDQNDFKKNLWENAEDKISWEVFMMSELFDPWFYKQYQNLLDEYNTQKKQFTEQQMATYACFEKISPR
jgi:hypothetical protein